MYQSGQLCLKIAVHFSTYLVIMEAQNIVPFAGLHGDYYGQTKILQEISLSVKTKLAINSLLH